MDINVKNSIYLIKNKFKNKIINRNLINTSILLYEKADNKFNKHPHIIKKNNIRINFRERCYEILSKIIICDISYIITMYN